MHIGRLQAGTAGEALGTKELEFADWEVRPRRARAASPRSGAPDSARDAPPGAPARQVCDLDDVEGDCDPRPRIVVLGSGWAAHAFVKARAPRRPLVVKGCFCKRSLSAPPAPPAPAPRDAQESGSSRWWTRRASVSWSCPRVTTSSSPRCSPPLRSRAAPHPAPAPARRAARARA